MEKMFGGASGGGRFVAYDVMLLATMIAVGLGLAVCSPATFFVTSKHRVE